MDLRVPAIIALDGEPESPLGDVVVHSGLSVITTELLQTPWTDRQAVRVALAAVGALLGAHSVSYFEYQEQRGQLVATSDWVRPGWGSLPVLALPLRSEDAADAGQVVALVERALAASRRGVVGAPALVNSMVAGILALEGVSARRADIEGWAAAAASAIALFSRCQQLQRQASFDGESGLANQAMAVVELGRMLARVQRQCQGGVAVISLVIDSLSEDSDLGAAQRRSLLRRVGAGVEQSVRETDLVAVDDDGCGFVILCDDVTEVNHAVATAQRLCREVEALEPIAQLGLGVVAGVAHTSRSLQAGVLLRMAASAASDAAKSAKTGLAGVLLADR